MKRLTGILLILLFTITVAAQDFKLYYAKNVTDVTQFRDINILDAELNWREVNNGDIDGNQADVEQLKQMLGETRMKGLEDQRMFWHMRDRMLLCFRINDGKGDTGSYQAEVTFDPIVEGEQPNPNIEEPVQKTLATSSYFFINIPRQCEMVEVNVWKATDPDKRIKFRYWVYDWNDKNLYIFQLDQKRQSTGDTYKMEYVISHNDADGNSVDESHILEVKETYFQSFYVPDGHTLTNVYFLTGNNQEGDVKLQMGLTDLHTGIDTDYNMDIPTLTSKFKLDKHENREFVNFNWLGTGLFEKYDTLFINLRDNMGKQITRAQMNVHRVDDDGTLIADNDIRYLGYDKNSDRHKVLTHGHPAYIEIIANGCLPTLYRYKGAADKDNRILKNDLCSAKITLKKGNIGTNGFAVCDQNLLSLQDDLIPITRNNTEYAVVSILEASLTGRPKSEVFSYMEDGGIKFPKLLNNNPVQKLAQLELVFSTNKGSGNPSCHLTCKERETGTTREASIMDIITVSSREFTKFTRDYYFTRFNLLGVVGENKQFQMTLSTPDASYDEFPILKNLVVDPEQIAQDGEKQSTSDTDLDKDEEGSNQEKVYDSFGEGKMGFGLSPNIKFNTPHDLITVDVGFNVDLIKQLFGLYVTLNYNKQNKKGNEGPKLKSARDNIKNVQNWNAMEGEKGDNINKMEMLVKTQKFDDWVTNEANDIFNVSKNHIGTYFGFKGKMAYNVPFGEITKFQLDELSAYLELGCGWGQDLSSGEGDDHMCKLRKFLQKWFSLEAGFVADCTAFGDFGIKTFKPGLNNHKDNYCFYGTLGAKLRFGAWFNIRTQKCALGGIQAGVRAGAKFQFRAGFVTPFEPKIKTCAGIETRVLALIQAFVSVKTVLFSWQGDYTWRWGKRWLKPEGDHNPYHDDFPYWLKDEKGPQLIGNSYRPLRAPATSDLGSVLISDLAYDANPHYLGSDNIVVNDLGNPKDYNDDKVTLLNVNTQQRTTLSTPGTSASQHAHSKRGDREIIVYQQTKTVVNSSQVTTENMAQQDKDMQRHTQIRASMRQADGNWKHMDITPDDGFVDQKPMVTIQEDGKAACIYEHGDIVKDKDVNGEEPDSVTNYHLQGELMLRTYADGTWSEPTPLVAVSDKMSTRGYDLFMRNDTVLVGVNVATEEETRLFYISKPLSSPSPEYRLEELHPTDFCMNRVGKNAVVAMAYERPDSLYDVYVKTLDMRGQGDGRTGATLNISAPSPMKLKIVSERGAEDTNDFAVLWTEVSNVVRDAEEGSTVLDSMRVVLNATRIHLEKAPQVTYPLTVGAETEGLVMTDFDGYLDDSRIGVVYTLGPLDNAAAVVMKNEKEFTNSFKSDVTYSREALLGSSSLPVNVFIFNTGTSAIKSASVNINGQEIPIPDSFILPMTQSKFVVQYPIPDNFDGFMKSKVSVEYANVFRTKQHAKTRRSMLRQVQEKPSQRVTISDIDCNVISRTCENGVNTFIVELTDRSSRGLMPGTAVMLGVYPHPAVEATLTGETQTMVSAKDFNLEGGVRRAYAEITVSGITQPVDGYIVPKVVDVTIDDEETGASHVSNIRSSRNTPYVILYPSSEPTAIDAPEVDSNATHRVKVVSEEGGVRLSRLQADEEVRVFNANGICVTLRKAEGSTLFIPLSKNGIYVLSVTGEVFKFQY